MWLATAELIVFAAGSGVDELARASALRLCQVPRHCSRAPPVSSLVRAVLACLEAVAKPVLTAASLSEPASLARAAVLLDSLCPEGVLETTDDATLAKSVKLSFPVSE